MKLINYKNQHFNLIVREDNNFVNMLVPTKILIDIVKDKEYNTEEKITIIKELTDKLNLSNDS